MCGCHRSVATLEGTSQTHGHGERLGPLDLDVQAERLPKTGEEQLRLLVLLQGAGAREQLLEAILEVGHRGREAACNELAQRIGA